MHLAEILSRRQVPGAGLYLSLTRRCPLSCAHCSTDSSLASEEHEASIFVRLIESFTPDNRPEILVLTGGEALVRPRLVRELTDLAHAVGTSVVLASGMFFARQPATPPAVERAIQAVDHFTASLDIFHEQQVARTDVFRVIRQLLDRDQDVSFQVVGLSEQDPYLSDVIADVRCVFQDRVPALVNLVGAVGRARAWMNDEQDAGTATNAPIDADPCDLTAWPVVGYDGTVVACCNQEVINGPAPAHLRLGQAAVDDWATLMQRHRDSAMLRAIRMFGPRYIADRYSSGQVSCDGYCATCMHLSDVPLITERLEPLMARPAMRVVADQIALLQQEAFVARHAPPAFAYLAQLGAKPPTDELEVVA
jgi:organic radical activating enzyme